MSGAKLDIPPESEAGSSVRKVAITGTPCHIRYCKAIIEAKTSGTEETIIPLPIGDQIDPENRVVARFLDVGNDQVGRLIGKGGITIRQMQEVSGAHIEVLYFFLMYTLVI